MNKQEQKVVLNCTVGGIVKYPKKEGDTVKYAIEVEELTKAKLEEQIKAKFGSKVLTMKADKESVKPLINVKSNFDVPVYDKDKNLLEDVRIYHGASVYANISIKEYTYMGKSGITAYLTAFVLLENGEATGTSFDTVMNNLI